MKRAAKVDDNQPVIVEALRASGAFVQILSSIGKGCPDLAVGYRGAWTFLEVKDGSKCRSAATLTPAQVDWIVNLRNRAPVVVVSNVYEALEAVNKSAQTLRA